jgi:Xaa-Pro aminopeptidase
VDAGTVEAVRQAGAEVLSSGDLVQRFEAVWSDEVYRTHCVAADKLYRIKDRAFDLVRERVGSGTLTEYDVQQEMLKWFEQEGLVADDTPNVSAQENAGDPHYHPSRDVHRPIRRNEIVLLDLWGKLPTPGAVFADITWVGFTGAAVPDTYARAFAAARDGRDAGIELVQSAVRAGRLRDARRSPADPRHRLHDRTGRVYERVRRPDGDQHVRDRAGRGRHGARPAADGDSAADVSERN